MWYIVTEVDGKSNCLFLVPCKLTTIRFPHSAQFSKIVQTGVPHTNIM